MIIWTEIRLSFSAKVFDDLIMKCSSLFHYIFDIFSIEINRRLLTRCDQIFDFASTKLNFKRTNFKVVNFGNPERLNIFQNFFLNPKMVLGNNFRGQREEGCSWRDKGGEIFIKGKENWWLLFFGNLMKKNRFYFKEFTIILYIKKRKKKYKKEGCVWGGGG